MDQLSIMEKIVCLRLGRHLLQAASNPACLV